MTLPGHSVLPSLAVLFLGACAGERWVERLPRAPREMPLRVAARDLGPLFRPPADWPDAFLARGCGLGDDGTAAFTTDVTFPGANGATIHNAQIRIQRGDQGRTPTAPGAIAGYAGRVAADGRVVGALLFGSEAAAWHDNTLRPLLVAQDGGLTLVTDLSVEGQAFGIGESGLLVGCELGGLGPVYGLPAALPVAWDSVVATHRRIGAPGPFGVALDANAHGVVVGHGRLSIDGGWNHVGWIQAADGTVRLIGNAAVAVDDAGRIAVNTGAEAALNDADGALRHALAPLVAEPLAWARVEDLSEDGIAVGASNGREVVWSGFSNRGRARCRDLNELVRGAVPDGLVLDAVLRINARHDLLCEGRLRNAQGEWGAPHAWLVSGLRWFTGE